MAITRQQRRGVCKAASQAYVNQKFTTMSRKDRREFARQLKKRLMREVPMQRLEYYATPDEEKLVVPVENKIVRV